MPAKVATIEYDPNRSARIALLHYADGEKRYILWPDGLKVGAEVMSGETRRGQRSATRCRCASIPLGTVIHNIELKIGKGGQMVRSAGGGAQLMAREGDWAQVKLPSGEVRRVHVECYATIGQVGNLEHENVSHRQGRAQPLAGLEAAQPRRHHEPGRPPDGRRRRPDLRRPPSHDPVGRADQGLQDPQQQAHGRA